MMSPNSSILRNRCAPRTAHPSREPARQAERLLHRSGYPVLRRLKCEIEEGHLRMRGRLPSYHLKQVALALVAEVEGIRGIRDEIEVVRPARPEAAGSLVR